MTGWRDTLKRACERTSQAQVARRLRDASGSGFPSDSVVSQILNDRYRGRTDRIEDMVAGLWDGATVDCPVLGTIGAERCDSHQHRPYSGANPYRVALYRACRSGCPHSRLEERT